MSVYNQDKVSVGGWTLEGINYKLPDPPTKLKHRKQNILERLASFIMQSHVCQVCRRKEIWSVDGWLQIDDLNHHDSDGCSVVCSMCVLMNPKVFGKSFFDEVK